MRFFLGAIFGMFLLVVATFLSDLLASDDASGAQIQTIVNWDLAAQRVDRSFESMREGLHKLTR
jgi:hypothetical protein